MVKEDNSDIIDLDQTIEEFKTAKEYKFVYLVYAVSKKSKYFTPYTFKIVPFAEVDKRCFFTLSNDGLMTNLETDVTFTTFENFEEGFRNYQKLMQVSVPFYP